MTVAGGGDVWGNDAFYRVWCCRGGLLGCIRVALQCSATVVRAEFQAAWINGVQAILM